MCEVIRDYKRVLKHGSMDASRRDSRGNEQRWLHFHCRVRHVDFQRAVTLLPPAPPPLAREPVRKSEINAAKATQQVYGMTS